MKWCPSIHSADHKSIISPCWWTCEQIGSWGLKMSLINFRCAGSLGDKMTPRVSYRQFHSSSSLMGQKAKSRKHNLRLNNPHIPLKGNSGLASVQALNHFDQFYGSVYTSKWSSMRLGLMSQHKSAALVNNFGDSEETCDKLRGLGCVDIHQEFLKGYRRVEPYITFEEGEWSVIKWIDFVINVIVL